MKLPGKFSRVADKKKKERRNANENFNTMKIKIKHCVIKVKIWKIK